MNQGIPKRIIQTGKSTDLPLLSKAAVTNVRLLNPDFEYLFFDDRKVEEFINTEFPEYRSVFYSFLIPIQRYDFFRYLAIYRFGGFYLDLDVILAQGLADLFECGCVFPFEALTINEFLRRKYGMDWEIGNYAFGATAGHPFISAIIENCVRALNDVQWAGEIMKAIPRWYREEFYVLYTTGPGLVSRTLAEYPEASKEIKVLFPENVCDEDNWNLFGQYGIHLRIGTWRSKPLNLWQHFKRFVRWRWFLRLKEKQIKDSKAMGVKRSL